MKTYKDLPGDGGSHIVEQVVSAQEKLRSRLDKIKHKIALMSGKGGVGKSSLTANMAATLVDRGYTVGILDADLNGPSIGHLLGVGSDKNLQVDETGVHPGDGAHGIRIMSMDMLVSGPDTPVMWTEEKGATAVWVSTMECTALRELLADTHWGELDFLLIDMPPGSDRIDNVRDLIPELAGVVEITIPSPLSQHIVSKSISKNNKIGVPIIGLIENMAGYICPHCHEEGELFEGQDVHELSRNKKIPYIGKIPFDPRMSRKNPSGSLFYMEHKDSVAGQAIASAVDTILGFIQKNNDKEG
ncbi:MAG: P-loop NTPase [Nitrospinaceae bacterium]|nr:Mrp/NBP35 family ATP-binding protein [Nitrospinaceae bacterium]NIR55425.1 Mrp/NBP35 family ATP-binding protein [Nitrospinaceae bacterium]NIS85865.1 Mrp/NBP35 family ATP-binding protein [Nitrospinaceae bacterium]NIT82709.1 Mrp/NBP35 family ATP-binding protein [Nitrospinaceae bacterium]NIU44918.1 Mrp/NBP35 family ATP-binding protein [Nitrospinaceae bacterium]